MRTDCRRSRRDAPSDTPRRPGRRPRGVVGEGILPTRRTRRSGRPSPPSSRRPANRSSSSIQHRTSFPAKLQAALEAGQPPDFTFGLWLDDLYAEVGPRGSAGRPLGRGRAASRTCSIPDQLDRAMLLNAKTGQRVLYGLPVGEISNYIHVWKSLLEGAGFSLDDIPKEWDGFWSFWCDRVQPAVRRASGRDDIWGIGLSMSAECQRHGRSVPPVRRRLRARLRDSRRQARHRRPGDQATAGQGDRQLYGGLPQGLYPAQLVSWDDPGNNKAFLAQTIVMTLNVSLSIPGALKRERPDDYFNKAATIQWPLGPDGEPFPIVTYPFAAMAFKDGANVETAKEFVRFLVAEGWLDALSRLLRRAHAAIDCQHSSTSRSGSTRATGTTWPRRSRRRRACLATTTAVGLRRPAARSDLPGARLGEGDPSDRDRGHQPRAGGRRGDRPDQADS